MKIVQIIPSLAHGDAVSNDTIAIQTILREEGYETGIYSDIIDPRLPEGIAKPLRKLPCLRKEDLLIYHACTGASLNFQLPQFGGKKLLIYHNITPPSFFHHYSREIEAIQKRAYEGMRFLSDKVDYCIADSDFNRSDLQSFGFGCPIDVCPIIIPFADYKQHPDPKTMNHYQGDGWTNLLFVGRIVPNKKQEDVIQAFYFYHKEYNPKSRLFLIGSGSGMEKYEYRLRNYTKMLDISNHVFFLGHIRFSEILSYYSLADAFVCMSEHEGFCVPLIEAMLFETPIVAYDSSAVSDTLGRGGLLIKEKNPHLTAGAINRVITDKTLQAYLIQEQKNALSRFSYDNIRKQFISCLRRAIES